MCRGTLAARESEPYGTAIGDAFRADAIESSRRAWEGSTALLLLLLEGTLRQKYFESYELAQGHAANGVRL